jgi:CheY-like chemotaxis protein
VQGVGGTGEPAAGGKSGSDAPGGSNFLYRAWNFYFGEHVVAVMNSLSGLRILVVEDELLIALALEDILLSFDCQVIGPVSQVDEALAAARSERFDGALLDVNVRGKLVYPVAEELMARNVPIVFCSGYSDTSIMPPRFRALPQIAKPYDDTVLRRAMESAFLPRPASTPSPSMNAAQGF